MLLIMLFVPDGTRFILVIELTHFIFKEKCYRSELGFEQISGTDIDESMQMKDCSLTCEYLCIAELIPRGFLFINFSDGL